MGRLAAGSLNQRIAIQYKTGALDSWGQPQDTWLDLVAGLPANIKTINGAGFVGQEMIAGGIEVSRTTTSIRIRMRRDVRAGMRVVYRGQYYDIKQVLPDEEGNEFVDLAVSSGTNEG